MNKQNDKSGNYFLAPKSIFSLGLSSGEITLYLYLMFCEDRNTYKCYPSYSTIGKATKMSNNTVRKYVESLERRGLIFTEHTTVITKDGRAHNGSLRYTINPIQPIEEMYFQKQLREANTRRKLIEYERRKQNEKVNV